MPEYSSTTITPADGVQVPSMNGSTSGNFLLSALRDYILASKGQANGLASLGSDGKLTPSQLPDLADDVIVVASYAVLPATGTAGKIYITADNNKMYRWDSDLSTPDYVELSVDLSEYAKLTDLAAEESARETSDANLNNAIDNLDHRLENLEQSKGDYIVSAYKDGSVTPSGKGEWCVVEGVEGVSRVENQLVYMNASSSTINGVTFTESSDGTITVSGTATADAVFNVGVYPAIPSGHICLMVYGVVCVEGKFRIGDFNNGYSLAYASGARYQALGALTSLKVQVFSGATVNFTCRPTLTDLSVYFGGSIPADADTFAHIQTNYPHLLLPTEYGTRIVDWTGNGVRAEGVNIWNEEWEVGTLTWATGEPQDSTTFFRSKNYIPAKPNTRYYTTFGIVVYAYDKDYNMLLQVNTGESARTFLYDTPSGTAYLRFRTYYQMTVYGNNIQICDNSLSDAVKQTYHPWFAPNTLSFPSTSLKSAGSVREKYLLESGEVTHPLKDRLITDSELNYTKAGGIFYALLSDAKPVADSNVKANILCDKFFATSRNGMTQKGQFSISSSGSTVYINFYWDDVSIDAFKTAMAGVSFRYELNVADPSTPATAILDNTLLTEAYGRLSTVQTGTVVDGIADLGFITL